MDDFDEKREEFEEKVRLLEERLDELEGDPEKNEVPPYSEITLDGSQFLVHWITADEVSTYSACSEIDNTYKAQVAFKEAASLRDNIENPGRPVLHGDLLVLQCNRYKSEDDYEETKDFNSCYFIGMCVFVDGSFQEESTVEDITCKHTSGNEVIREFVAWDTCGGATDGLTEDIEFKELLDPSGSYVTYGEPGSDGLRLITINLPTKKRSMVFKKGLLTEYEEGSEETLAISFTDLSGEDSGSGDYKVIDICEDGETVPIRVRIYPSEEE